MPYYTHINLMCPTSGRATTRLPQFIDSAMSTAERPDCLRWTFCVGEDDEETLRYLKSRLPDAIVVTEHTETVNLAQYFNMMYDAAVPVYGDHCLVSMLGDDMVFMTPGWDGRVLDAMNNQCGLGIVYCDDNYIQHEDLAVNLFTTPRFVKMTGKPFMAPMFAIEWIDTTWTVLCKRLGMATYLSDVIIDHRHSSRVGLDKTYIRMRKENDASAQKAPLIEGYVDEIIASVMRELSILDTGAVAVIMATYNREHLLEQTVISYNDAAMLPRRIDVYDDGSTTSTIATASKLRGGVLHHMNHSGPDAAIPAAIKEVLKTKDVQAVMVLDSDSAFSRYWWIRALDAWNEQHKEPRVVSLFNTANHRTVIEAGADMLLKRSLGGFAVLIDRQIAEEALANYSKTSCLMSWDNWLSEYCHTHHYPLLCTRKTWVQHTGYADGTHVSADDKADIGVDFVGTHITVKRATLTESPKRILWCCMGRHGDIIAASIIANMLIARGHRIVWLCIKQYLETAAAVCPGGTIRMIEPMSGIPDDEWSEMQTCQMKERYPGFDVYINAQLGARENHDGYLRSGKHPVVWIKEKVERETGWDLGYSYARHLSFRDDKKPVNIERCKPGAKLAIIAPEAKTSRSITAEDAKRRFDELDKAGYEVKYMVQTRPAEPWAKVRREYLFGLSFVECIKAIRECDLFVGQDSGLSWAALYSKCRKEIHHKRERIDRTNTYFSMLDGNTEDIIDKSAKAKYKPKLLLYYEGFHDIGIPMGGTSTALLRHAINATPKFDVTIIGDKVANACNYRGIHIDRTPGNREAYMHGFDAVVFATTFGNFNVGHRPSQPWIVYHNCWHPDAKVVERSQEIAMHMAVSGKHADNLARHGVPPDKMQAIAHYVPPGFVPDKAVARMAKTVLFVGPPNEHKGIRAVCDAVKAMPGYKLIVVGGGVLWNDTNLTDELALRSQYPDVQWVGAVPSEQMPSWYGKAQVLVLASRLESFSLASIEAQWCGCVPVLPDVGGTAATMIPNETGILYKDDVEEAIRRGFALANTNPQEKMKKFVTDNFQNPAQFTEAICSVL